MWGKPKRTSRRCNNNWPTSNPSLKPRPTPLLPSTDPLNEKLETVSLKPTKANIAVKLVTLAWTPHWQDGKGILTPAWQ